MSNFWKKMRRRRPVTWAIALWVVFLVGIFWLLSAKLPCVGYVKTEAVVVRVEKMGGSSMVVYSYDANGIACQSIKNKPFWKSVREGDSVTVRYDPKDPHILEVGGESVFVVIVTLLSGAGAMLLTLKDTKRMRGKSEV